MLATGLEHKDSNEDKTDNPGTVRKPWAEDLRLLDWGDRGLFYEYLEMGMLRLV